MDLSSRVGQIINTTVGGETVSAYCPKDLPPSPPLIFCDRLLYALQSANQSLGRLDGVSLMLPNVDLLTYMFLRKEALISSQIEGTQSSFADLMLYESDQVPGVPIEDVEEVANYVAALNHGVRRLDSGFPLSLRLLREVHAILLKGARGQEKLPGEFRRSQNWIGGTRPGNAQFVPPPSDHVMPCMSALEKFLHNDPVKTAPLIKAALSHVQFETIHPFLDGNGRVGRLMITLILYAESVLKNPTFYLSLYFKVHRDQYYDLLQRVRLQGDWEAWLHFFLEAIQETSDQAVATIHLLQRLFHHDEKRLLEQGRSSQSMLRVYRFLQRHPITTIAKCVHVLDSTVPTVTSAIEQLHTLGIVNELTGKARNRLYSYTAYVDILAEGADPLVQR